MSVCAHDRYCPGYGDAHDAGLTRDERLALNLPAGKELSMKKTKRLMRSFRKAEREREEVERKCWALSSSKRWVP